MNLKTELLECSDEIIKEAEKLWYQFIYTKKDSEYHLDILNNICQLAEDMISEIENIEFDEDEWR